jgi:hypothetical protein
MPCYIDSLGNYYSGDRINSRDQEVPERPSPYYCWVDGSWVFDREAWLNADIRPARNRLLDEADTKYCNADKWDLLPSGQKEAWRTYKQALRNLPETIDPEDPLWPSMPEE